MRGGVSARIIGGLILGLVLGLWASAVAAQSVYPGAPDVIREIRVEGIQRIEPETVRSYMHIRVGDPFDAKKIDESLKSLFATGLFSDVSIRREGDALIVKVAENPVINRIAFEGNDYISDEDLRKEVQLRSRIVYTRTRVQNDVKRIIDLYRSQGRFAVTVEPKVIQRSQNRVDLIFDINEGPPTLIEKIVFIGNKHFSDSRLKGVIRSTETAWYTFLTADDVYDPSRVRVDEELLRRFYRQRGYADFAVLSSTAELSPDREHFYLTFTLSEGPRYRFGKIGLITSIKGLDVSKLRDVLTVSQGDWFDGEEVERTVNKLTDAVSAMGFPFIDIRPEPKRDTKRRTIGVTFDIKEGPHVYVDRINIRGNVRTLDRVIRREILLSEGDPFNRARLARSERNIRALGYFKKVEVKRVPGPTPDKTTIDVDVQEQSTGSFSIGAGLSSSEGVITQAQLQERNLLGKGQKVKLSLQLGTKSQQIDSSFTEPHFLGRNLSAGFDLFKTITNKRKSITFNRDRVGGALRLGFDYNRRLHHTVNYKLESKKVSDVDPGASIFIKRQEGKAVTSSFGHVLSYDVRDNPRDPSEGFYASLANDFAGFGGTTRFVRTTINAAQYFPLFRDSVLALKGEFGYIAGIGKDIRIDDRYFVGGDSLRGFEPGGIGPRDRVTTDALGGNRFFTGTMELAIPLGAVSTFKPTGFLFTDFGTLGKSDDSGPTVEEDDLIRASVGTGIGIKTPFGAIRVNYAFAARKASFDKTQTFSFKFGAGF